MFEIEELYLDDGEQVEQIEYVTTEPAQKPLPVQRIKTDTTTADVSETKRKLPIVRVAGEVVTPVQFRAVARTPVSHPVHLTHPRVDWTPRTTLKRCLIKPSPTSIKARKTSDYHTNNDDSDDEEYQGEQTIESTQNRGSGPSQDRLARIESKLDMILEKLSQHDAALKLLKFNIKDLRIELKNSKNAAEYQSDGLPKVPVKRMKKRIVLFPVTDDNYLYRLEDLIETDEEIRSEVAMLFSEGPTTSVYDFLRHSMVQLFENCSKHTWTGRTPHNASADKPASNPACKMNLMELLVACCGNQFANSSQDYIHKECRRALYNVNLARDTRMARRLQKEGVMDVAVEEVVKEIDEAT